MSNINYGSDNGRIGRVLGTVKDGDLRVQVLADLRHVIEAFSTEARAQQTALDAYRAEVAAWRQETTALLERLDQERQETAARLDSYREILVLAMRSPSGPREAPQLDGTERS